MIKILIIMAIVGALIGWMTNVIAIKLMFRPINPIRVPIVGFEIQGLIPKRKAEIAKSIGEVVNEELISMDQIVEQLVKDTDKSKIIEMIKMKVLKVADDKMPSLIPSMFKSSILSNIGDIIDDNGEEMIEEMTDRLTHMAIDKINISEIVEAKIMAYEFEKLEEIIIKIAKNELKHIEVLGGIIGFVIGIIQGGLVMVLM